MKRDQNIKFAALSLCNCQGKGVIRNSDSVDSNYKSILLKPHVIFLLFYILGCA